MLNFIVHTKVPIWVGFAKKGVLKGWHKGTHAHHNIVIGTHKFFAVTYMKTGMNVDIIRKVEKIG